MFARVSTDAAVVASSCLFLREAESMSGSQSSNQDQEAEQKDLPPLFAFGTEGSTSSPRILRALCLS